MSGEDDLFPGSLPGFLEAAASAHLLADQLRCRKRCMAFVEMIHIDLNAEGAHRSDAANAKHDFLGDTLLAEPAIELSRDPRISVLRNIGVKQIKRVVAELVAFPDFTDYVGLTHFDGNAYTRIFQKIVNVVVVRVVRPAVVSNLLIRVTLLPFQANRDDRRVNVLGPFNVISRQNTKSSGIHLKIGIQTILHTEIRYCRQFLVAHKQAS
ncbi:hypothetical protein D3C71_1485130 [compost metagenome]